MVARRSGSSKMKVRSSSFVTPRWMVIFSISRSRMSRAKPTSAAADLGSRSELTTTSSPMKPMTIGSARRWPIAAQRPASASRPRCTSGWFGA
jgi:hypothetical protein